MIADVDPRATAYCHRCRQGRPIVAAVVEAEATLYRPSHHKREHVLIPPFARLVHAEFACGHRGWRVLTLDHLWRAWRVRGVTRHRRTWLTEAMTRAALEGTD